LTSIVTLPVVKLPDESKYGGTAVRTVVESTSRADTVQENPLRSENVTPDTTLGLKFCPLILIRLKGAPDMGWNDVMVGGVSVTSVGVVAGGSGESLLPADDEFEPELPQLLRGSAAIKQARTVARDFLIGAVADTVLLIRPSFSGPQSSCVFLAKAAQILAVDRDTWGR